jgi:tRNA nucleotidyltransferase/poly(A) polymerase
MVKYLHKEEGMAIKLFEVGGSIRDELMGLESADRDFCAESPKGWESLLSWANNKMRVFKVTPEFFTIRGSLGPDVIDIVMCRKDGASSDGRHPDEVEPGTLLDDLARRDFTCNAMARPVNRNLEIIGDIIDPFNGAEDLMHGVLRSVGNMQDRFEEDNLRLMRACRFAVTKGLVFHSDIEEMVSDHRNWRSMMETVSIERTREELNKMFSFSTPAAMRFMCGLRGTVFDALFDDTGLWLKPTLAKR